MKENDLLYRAKIGTAVIVLGAVGVTRAILMKNGQNTAERILGVVEVGAVEVALGGAVVWSSNEQNKNQNNQVIILPKPPSENSGRE